MALAATPADLVMRNGYVYTVDGQNSVQQAIAVSGGKIVYVGNDAGLDDYIGKQTQLIDLGGRMLMPGFVDAHMHPGDGGRAITLCDLKYQSLTGAQFQSNLQACLDADKDKGPDAWLEVGWDRMGMSGLDGDADKSTLDALKTNADRYRSIRPISTPSEQLAGPEVAGHQGNA